MRRRALLACALPVATAGCAGDDPLDGDNETDGEDEDKNGVGESQYRVVIEVPELDSSDGTVCEFEAAIGGVDFETADRGHYTSASSPALLDTECYNGYIEYEGEFYRVSVDAEGGWVPLSGYERSGASPGGSGGQRRGDIDAERVDERLLRTDAGERAISDRPESRSVSLLTPAVAFGAGLVLFVWAAIGAWVNFDAHARGSDHPAFWGIVVLISGIMLFYYLLWWRDGRPRDYPPGGWSEPPPPSSSPASADWSSEVSCRRRIRLHS